MTTTTRTRKEYKPPHPGPYIDRAVRILSEDDPNAFCDWLGESRAQDVQVLSSSFAAQTLYADFVGQVASDRLIHVEYIGRPNRKMAVRMVAYLAQLMRQHPMCSITQYALVQGPGRLPSIDDPRTGFTLGQRTINLREREPAEMATHPGLAGLAILAGSDDAISGDTLRTALRTTRGLEKSRERRLMEAMWTVATTRIDSTTVEKIVKESDMTVESVASFYRDTSFGQEIYKEGSAEILTEMLRARFGHDPRIAEIATQLARDKEPRISVWLINEASTLDDLRGWLLPTRPTT